MFFQLPCPTGEVSMCVFSPGRQAALCLLCVWALIFSCGLTLFFLYSCLVFSRSLSSSVGRCFCLYAEPQTLLCASICVCVCVPTHMLPLLTCLLITKNMISDIRFQSPTKMREYVTLLMAPYHTRFQSFIFHSRIQCSSLAHLFI